MTSNQEALKNEVEGLLVDLTDNNYRVTITYNELLAAWGRVIDNDVKSIICISISNKDIKDILEIKDHLNTLHDFMSYKDSKIVSIDITSRRNKIEVELLEGPNKFSKLRGKKGLDFDKIWDSIDYSLFASDSEIGKFSNISIKYLPNI